jgi:hypothetical protein
MRVVWGLLIRGLSVDGSANPTLFVDGDLDASTLPSPLSTSSQIKGWLVPDSFSGAKANLDLRNPLISATAPTIQLQDDATGTLAALLEGDPGYLNTSRWTLDSTVSLSASATSLVVTGHTTIAVGDELYLNGECVTVTNRALTHSGQVNVQTLTVTRGACGSDAKAHAVDPSTYPPGTDGSQACLTLYSRPQFENGLFEAQIFQFKMDDTNPASVSSILHGWFGFVEARPQPDGDFRWTVAVTHASKALAEFVVPGAKDLELSHCINVVATKEADLLGGMGGFTSFARLLPGVVKFNFTRAEFEALFNEPAHLSQSTQFDSSLITTLSSRLAPNGKVSREIVAKVGPFSYVWNLRSLTYVNADKVTGIGVLVDHDQLATITAEPASYPPIYLSAFPRADGYSQGFIKHNSTALATTLQYDRVRTEQGEAAPVVTGRWAIKTTFLEALLYVSTSGHGGTSNGAYDLLQGGWPCLDPDWLNTGSAPVSPLDVSEGTAAILELNALLSETYDYYFTPGDNLGEWLRNELLLHCCLLSFVPSTGKLAARLWSRKRSSPTALNPVVAPDGDVQREGELEEIRALYLERGFDPVTLAFKHKRAVATPDARARDFKDATVIRIWKRGATEFSDAELASGPLARLARALTTSHLGRPFLYAIPVAADAGHVFGDLLTWTDPAQSTATGRGVTALPLIALAVVPDPRGGRSVVYGLWDVLGAEVAAVASAGRIAPALKVLAVGANSSTEFVLVVTSTGADTGFRIDTSHGSIWTTLAGASGRVRIVTPTRHNPTGTAERTGLGEVSVTVNSVAYDSGSKRSTMVVTIGASWVRGGLVALDVIKPGARVLLQRYLPASVNPEATVVKGEAGQDYNSGSGRDFIKYSVPASRQPYDARRSLIGS